MGDPRKTRKKYTTPGHPWNKARIEEEKALVKDYGLRNKKEVWRMASFLKNAQMQAKRLIVTTTKQAEIEKQNLVNKLKRYGLVSESSSIEDILGLTLKDILDRRLQSILLKRGLARTVKQSRQFIVHGHVKVGDKLIDSPSFLVPVSDEETICFMDRSSLSNSEHPERSIPEKVEKKK